MRFLDPNKLLLFAKVPSLIKINGLVIENKD